MHRFQILGVVLASILLAGCGARPAGSSSESPRKHEHLPPHGGTPVVLGNEEYHLELVRNGATGTMQAYVMDGELENFVRISTESFEIVATPAGREEILVFKAIASTATGEKVGDTAMFQAEAGWLKSVGTFDAVLKELTVRGRKFERVAFNVPKGNDSDKKETKQPTPPP